MSTCFNRVCFDTSVDGRLGAAKRCVNSRKKAKIIQLFSHQYLQLVTFWEVNFLLGGGIIGRAAQNALHNNLFYNQWETLCHKSNNEDYFSIKWRIYSVAHRLLVFFFFNWPVCVQYCWLDNPKQQELKLYHISSVVLPVNVLPCVYSEIVAPLFSALLIFKKIII